MENFMEISNDDLLNFKSGLKGENEENNQDQNNLNISNLDF